ncbi:MAG: CpaF family protein [Lachnospiraceae bacterium]|nr:CpaF family protein [Lachnospiraceae bacterium]
MFDGLLTALTDAIRGRDDLSDRDIRALADDLIRERTEVGTLSIREKRYLSSRLFHSVRGLGVIQALIDDDEVSEIMVNGCRDVFVERRGIISKEKEAFASKEELEDVIRRIAGRCNRVINESRPIVDARLENGSRVNAVLPPIAPDGPILTIRRFRDQPIDMTQLVRGGSLTREAAEDLGRFVQCGYSIMVSGGTSAGKTTFLNALSGFVGAQERVITIEDNAELRLQGIDNLVRLEARPPNMEGSPVISIRDLIRTSLRMRPDRIIVGEVRDEAAAELLQALNTGHSGSISTIHANSAVDTLSRLETLTLLGQPMPLVAVRRQIASAIDLIVYLERLSDRSRRVMQISEVLGMGEEDILIHDLYRREPGLGGQLVKVDELKRRDKLRRFGYEA